jgi:hypothetical protein
MISSNKGIKDKRWWMEIFRMFVHSGEYFEIHCWKNELDAIGIAEQFGEIACFDIPNFKIIHGLIHERFVDFYWDELRPIDNKYYQRIVPFYTIHIGDDFSSEEYGSRILLRNRSEQEKEQIEHILLTINENIKIRIY